MKTIKTILGCLLTTSVLFFSSCAANVKDIDGNAYKTLKIGNQEWMTANLNVSHFRNGDAITEVKTNEEWARSGKDSIPAWCYYNNDPENGKTYGKLYNWYAVNDSRGLAPAGWHTPSVKEWIGLTEYLGEDNAGIKLKSATGWTDDGKSTNESGFSVLPGGYRLGSDGTFDKVGYYGRLWCSTEYSSCCSWGRNFNNDLAKVGRGANDKADGFTVRCIKD